MQMKTAITHKEYTIQAKTKVLTLDTPVSVVLLTIIFAITPYPVFGGNTHLGQPSQEHVVLSLGSDPGDVCTLSGVTQSFFRLSRTGTLSASAFVVPSKMKLIITDVHWTVISSFDEPFVVGREQYLGIWANFSQARKHNKWF